MFQHDCTKCKFMGHYCDHDVYLCESSIVSIVARYGDDGPDYFSTLLSHFKRQIKENEPVLTEEGIIPFQEYVFKEPEYKAIMLAMTQIEN